jgi:hypothetical protein
MTSSAETISCGSEFVKMAAGLSAMRIAASGGSHTAYCCIFLIFVRFFVRGKGILSGGWQLLWENERDENDIGSDCRMAHV